MNMNKTIKFILIFIISLLYLNINVHAVGCNTYASKGESVCITKSSDGYKCEWNGTLHGGSRCYKGSVPTEETIDSITSCNDITEPSVCSSTNINGKDCIWRQNACYTGFEDNPSNDDYQIGTNNNIQNNNGNTNDSNVACNTYTTEQQCGTIGKCEWNKVENECQEVYVAEMPCDDDNIKIALRFFGYLLMVAKVAIPLIIIVMGTIDLFKSVIDKDEKSFAKQLKILIMRIVAGIFVFFLPSIIYALFGISSDLNIVSEDKYKGCIDCVLKPTICQVSSENKAG